MRTISIPQVVPLAIFLACTKAGEHGPSSPAPASETGYAVCGGQNLTDGAAQPRRGPVDVQLAPAFIDEMSACRPESTLPEGLVANAGDGIINQKGDCEYAGIGVACHYHAGSEFISSSAKGQTPGQGELHCIFPSSDPKSPSVYGGHVACRGAERIEPHGGHALSHDVKAGATCPAALLSLLRSFQAFRCCDDGTLTNPIANLVEEGRNDIRPDFRIGSETIEIDCALLANLTPHDANSPALGGVSPPVFSGLPAH